MTGASERPTFPPTQRIGIFVFKGFEPIDVFGFAEAFTIARFLGRRDRVSKNRDRLRGGPIAAKFLAAVLAQPRAKKLMSREYF